MSYFLLFDSLFNFKRLVKFPTTEEKQPIAAEQFTDDSTLLSIITRSTRSLMNTEIENTANVIEPGSMDESENTLDKREHLEDQQQQQQQKMLMATARLRRIRRGLSARRYLRNLTKNWDQTLLESFVKDGKLNADEIESSNSSGGNGGVTSVDDLSLSLPPLVYRFDQSWMSATVDMRSYKFIRAQDFDLSRGIN